MPPYRERPYIPAKDPLTAIPPSRHPFQFWVMVALCLNGVQNFIAAGSPALAAMVDPFYHKVWALTLALGCATALVGAFWRDRITGLLMERIGLVAIGVATPTYAVAFLVQAGPAMSVPATIASSAGIAALWRVVHVNRELKVLKGFLRKTHISQDFDE